jgi:hypothetical protein
MLRSIQTFFQYVFGAIERLDNVAPNGMIQWESSCDRLESKNEALPGLKHRFLKRLGLRFHRPLRGFRTGLLPDVSAAPMPKNAQHQEDRHNTGDDQPEAWACPRDDVHAVIPCRLAYSIARFRRPGITRNE